nr:bifunctional 5,10-methylene-tetrahydrofolate dehydrogenase/5,10-methylene-tetrahydrofolate cyclohydrolase [bacterium]
MTQGARIIDGRALAARTRVRLAEEISRRGREVTLAVLLVGDDPASAIYVRGKERAASEVGIRSLVRREPNSLSQEGAERIVEEWANDSTIHAILVQLPLPPGLNTQRVILPIPPAKDVH